MKSDKSISYSKGEYNVIINKAKPIHIKTKRVCDRCGRKDNLYFFYQYEEVI